MANFRTHITVASLVSGALAGSLYAVERVTAGDLWALFALGTLGGVLPDLDADDSTPSQLLYACLAALLAFLALYAFARNLSVLELWLLVGLVFLTARYLLGYLFGRWTVHRGIFHSLAAAACCGLVTVTLVHRFLGLEAARSWLYGVFLSLGYLLHLVLDELFAVDLGNRALKRSFGSGVKPVDFGNWRASAAMLLALAAAFAVAPSADGFLAQYGSGKLYEDVYRRLLPEQGWPLLGKVRLSFRGFPSAPAWGHSTTGV